MGAPHVGESRWSMIVALCVALMATASCTVSAQVAIEQSGPSAVDPVAVATPLDDGALTSERAVSQPPVTGGIDHRLFRDDIDCEKERVDVFPELAFVVAHQVVDGNLGAPCFGDPDSRVNLAWQSLVAMTPPERLDELGLFGGFSSSETGQTTLAFATSIHETDPLYAVAVNLDAAVADPHELALTMAHEFGHVVSTQPNQFDPGVGLDECTTWHNRQGCYRSDSLMYRWIEQFWSGDLIRSVVPDAEPSLQTGIQRCRRHRDRFISAYAASHPEEDFAESFSAFVLRTNVSSPDVRARMEWFAGQPELAAFRNRAVESGLGPLPNLFQPCR